ncbi:MAG TPA: helix-turn-helix domain-containing protein [Gemmatimonadaceae bacterium]|nr:helix-turn-helix domain-containing protein [Gemmatimonadaceae bacterium]
MLPGDQVTPAAGVPAQTGGGRRPSSTPARGGRAAADADATPDAATRILHATARLLAERGVARFNLQDVAEHAAVSKGLIHYHYHDKDTLLTRLVEALAADVVRRRREALAAATPAMAVDALWAWLHGELRRGHLRVLQELAQEPGALVRSAIHAAATARHAAAAETTAQLFDLLGLRPRVPPALLAEVVVSFEDGLVLDAAVRTEQDPRVAFDVFWLAVLGMAE